METSRSERFQFYFIIFYFLNYESTSFFLQKTLPINRYRTKIIWTYIFCYTRFDGHRFLFFINIIIIIIIIWLSFHFIFFFFQKKIKVGGDGGEMAEPNSLNLLNFVTTSWTHISSLAENFHSDSPLSRFLFYFSPFSCNFIDNLFSSFFSIDDFIVLHFIKILFILYSGNLEMTNL